MRPILSLVLTVAMMALVVAPVGAEQPTPFVQSAHYGFSGVIT
jgi:hypothetical protein